MKLRAVKAMFLKDLREFRREKTAVFWVFVFPLMWISLFGLLWGGTSPAVTVHVGVVGDGAWVVHYMDNVSLNGKPLFKVDTFRNVSSSMYKLKHGSIDALIVFPSGFARNISEGLPATVKVYYNEGNPREYQIAEGTLSAFFSELSSHLAVGRARYLARQLNLSGRKAASLMGVAEPIPLVRETVPGENPSPMKFYVTGFIALQFLFATMSMIGSGTLAEIERGTLRRIAASPATAWDFLSGKVLSTLFVIFLSILTGMAFAYVVFKVTVFPGPVGWLIILLMAAFSMGLGLAVAMLTRSVKSTNAVINLVSWPMIFLAGIFVPLSTLPSWAKPIAEYYPIGRAVKDLRLLIIYGASPRAMLLDLVWLAVVSLATIAFALITYRWAIRRLSG